MADGDVKFYTIYCWDPENDDGQFFVWARSRKEAAQMMVECNWETAEEMGEITLTVSECPPGPPPPEPMSLGRYELTYGKKDEVVFEAADLDFPEEDE